jgi:hypothetical protein
MKRYVLRRVVGAVAVTVVLGLLALGQEWVRANVA